MIKEFKVEFAGSSYPAFYIDTREKAEKAIAKMMESSDVLAADCETAALPKYKHIREAALSPHLARPRLVQMFTGKGSVVIDLLKTGELPSLGKLFESRPSVFHNMNFDYKMLNKWHGVKYPDMHCTAIMARCCWQAMYPVRKSASLKDVAKALFKEDVIKKGGASDWGMPELTFEQVHYAAKDVVIQMRIYEKLSEWIVKLGLSRCYEVYRKAQIPMSMMELNGFNFDVEHHKINIVRWRQELADARDEVQRITGIGIITDTKVGEWLKQNLPLEVASIWPRTEKTEDEEDWEKVKLATNADAFVNFSHLELVKPFSRYQKMKKLCTSFGMNLVETVNPETKRIHAGYTICGARTGRGSCSNPNFQQSPRDKEFRKSFIASKGYELVVADYSQVEVRCIAEYAGEEKMIEAYEKGLDIYKFTAAHLSGKPYDKIGDESDERQSAKALVLGLNYGLGPRKFSHYAKKQYKVNITPEQAFIEVVKYRELYPSLYAWQLRQVELCVSRRYTCFEALGKSNKLSEEKHYGASMNHPIQGTCASIMYIALIWSERALRNCSARFLATVHDEIIIECLPKDVDFVKKTLTDTMISAYNKLMPSGRTLNKLVDPNSGINWCLAKEKKKVTIRELEKIYTDMQDRAEELGVIRLA